jgi:hypothetical protein
LPGLGLQISASQVGRITGVRHCALLALYFIEKETEFGEVSKLARVTQLVNGRTRSRHTSISNLSTCSCSPSCRLMIVRAILTRAKVLGEK